MGGRDYSTLRAELAEELGRGCRPKTCISSWVMARVRRPTPSGKWSNSRPRAARSPDVSGHTCGAVQIVPFILALFEL